MFQNIHNKSIIKTSSGNNLNFHQQWDIKNKLENIQTLGMNTVCDENKLWLHTTTYNLTNIMLRKKCQVNKVQTA